MDIVGTTRGGGQSTGRRDGAMHHGATARGDCKAALRENAVRATAGMLLAMHSTLALVQCIRLFGLLALLQRTAALHLELRRRLLLQLVL